MKIEVALIEDRYLEVDGVKDAYSTDDGYYFDNEQNETLLFVSKAQLRYYKKIN